MKNEARFVTSSHRLLARKGGARPALLRCVRSDGDQSDGEHHVGGDDALVTTGYAGRPATHPVVRAHRDIARAFAPHDGENHEAAADASIPPVIAEKSTLTLTLDSERRMHLRMACAFTGGSPQKLVTRALDQYLDTLDDQPLPNDDTTSRN